MSGRGSTTRGHGRGGTRGRGGASASRGTKRKASADSEAYEEGHVSAAKKTKTAIEPRAPSGRATRAPTRADNEPTPPDLGPAGPDLPRAKRPDGSIAADAAEAAAQAATRAEERVMLIARLAALTALEDENRAAEELTSISSLADLRAMEQDAEPVLTFTEEDFEHIEDDDAYHSVSEFEKPKPKSKAPTKEKPKKPGKRETRAAVDEQTKVLVEEKKKNLNMHDSNAAAASKSAGLSQSWKNGAGSKVASPPKLGGFEDEDARAARPLEDVTKGKGKGKAPRMNEMVAVLSSDVEETPVQVKVKAPRKRVAVKGEPTERIPALFLNKDKTPQIRMESSLTTAAAESPSDDKDLPAFVKKTWMSIYLPALYHELFISKEPMTMGTVGDDLKNPGQEAVTFLQAVLDENYPGNTWKIEWGDVICSKAISRIGEKRSAIGKAGDLAVKNSFDNVRYFKAHNAALRKRDVTRNDALYALQPNGPAFWKFPTPESVCLVHPKDPEYIQPKDYLESQMIITTLLQFVKNVEDYELIIGTHSKTKKPIVDPSSTLFVGLLGMAAAAVERGYEAHTSGQYIKPPAFSQANFGTSVAGFIKGMEDFTVSRWEALLEACGASATERFAAAERRLQATSLDGRREHMYVPSSP